MYKQMTVYVWTHACAVNCHYAHLVVGTRWNIFERTADDTKTFHFSLRARRYAFTCTHTRVRWRMYVVSATNVLLLLIFQDSPIMFLSP